MNPLALIQFWPYLLIAALALGIGGYVKGCTDEAARGQAFKAAVKAVGDAQEAITRKTVKTNLERKRVSDAENVALRLDLAAESKRLRIERSRRRFVSPAPSGAVRPAEATVSRAELQRILEQLDERGAGFAEQADRARLDLDTARRWAQQFKGE